MLDSQLTAQAFVAPGSRWRQRTAHRKLAGDEARKESSWKKHLHTAQAWWSGDLPWRFARPAPLALTQILLRAP
jgi:hypothetical protein